ncbi:arylformamidase [Peribacillus cavernae]|uniref:Kynurenine formamidase n=1 Tax=Peribacillus cavernae TaxID=1674310 RepID=A0A433HI13_9BACI|nr:arylformamidase [Peribacillus cavernae]MDQ0220447.1 arylformamidase [Peribacillus cavernae]RUQ28046.1 arylformamidase [Peribacillus cavernae]
MDKWLDISQPLNEKTACWPGDTPFSYKLNWTKQDGGSVNVGQINLSTHLGTHIDAPFHFDDKGKKVIELNLDIYIGPARVICLPNPQCFSIHLLQNFDLDGVERLLIRTGSWQDRSIFPESIPPVEPELSGFLAEKGVKLLGLDLPSVDELDSKELPAHHQLYAHGIHILEGIILNQIEAGEYFLSALPLPLMDGDGSPVRAALKRIGI